MSKTLYFCALVLSNAGSITAAENQNQEYKQALINMTPELLVNVKPIKDVYSVSDIIEISACIKNTTNDNIILYDWSEPLYFGGHMTYLLSMKNIPKENKIDITPSPHILKDQTLTPRISSFNKLPPNESTTAVVRKIALLIPGQLTVDVIYNQKDGCVYLDNNNKFSEIAGGWKGRRISKITINIEDKCPNILQAKYEGIKLRALDDKLDINALDELLLSMRNDKNIYAARCMVEIWKNTKNIAVYAKTLKYVVSMYEYGTAYESTNDMIDYLENTKSDENIRRRLLHYYGSLFLMKNNPMISIDKVGSYLLSVDEIKKLHNVINGIASQGNPELAVLSKKILAGETTKPLKDQD